MYNYSYVSLSIFTLIMLRVPQMDLSRRVALQVAQSLRDERIRQRVSMDQLAAKSGLSQPMISYVERGLRNPTLDTLLRIAAALDVDLSKLLQQALKRRRDSN
jgi:transcriptional regulator with XRE-family HTH domain